MMLNPPLAAAAAAERWTPNNQAVGGYWHLSPSTHTYTQAGRAARERFIWLLYKSDDDVDDKEAFARPNATIYSSRLLARRPSSSYLE